MKLHKISTPMCHFAVPQTDYFASPNKADFDSDTITVIPHLKGEEIESFRRRQRAINSQAFLLFAWRATVLKGKTITNDDFGLRGF